MLGSEILKRFEKAKQVVQKRFGKLGEIGDFLRHNGYEVHLDGFYKEPRHGVIRGE